MICKEYNKRIFASKINDCDIVVFKDDIVVIEAKNEYWYDASIKCDADGWDNALYEWWPIKMFKDFPNENYMKLCCKVNKEKVAIGKKRTFIAKENGILKLWANDIPFLRWNNAGQLDINIKIKRFYE
jgi:hypothetical protein